jgi:hypothetical protein
MSDVERWQARCESAEEEVSRLSLLVDELTAQRDAFGQKAHQLQERVKAHETVRNYRQQVVAEWVRDRLSVEAATSLVERVLRVLEEATELAQAEGLLCDRALAVVEHVYQKPPGDGAKEVGGLAVTLLAYCAARGISADEAEVREIERILKIDRAEMQRRHNVKADAGIGVRVT